LFLCSAGITRNQKCVAIETRRKEQRIERENFQTMLLQIEFGNDCRRKRAGKVSAGSVLESGDYLFAGGDTTDHRAALQDQDFFAGLGQIGRRHQAVVAGADDDRVVFIHRGEMLKMIAAPTMSDIRKTVERCNSGLKSFL
jgi:hypothetical protein